MQMSMQEMRFQPVRFDLNGSGGESKKIYTFIYLSCFKGGKKGKMIINKYYLLINLLI